LLRKAPEDDDRKMIYLCTRFWWESPKERDLSEDQGSEWILGRFSGGGGWIGFDWLKIGTSGELL
jgi:hypothetical protein